MSTARRFCLAASCAILFALPPAVAHAQTGAASITGLVLDQTNVPVPGVTITATNQATNVGYTAVSNQAGNYTITTVPVGTYIVKAELTGFRTASTAAVEIEAKQIARLDFKMSVGEIKENVEVTGTSPILQTETATVGEVISGNTTQSLPLNGRNTGQLALLLPGTVTYNPRGFTNIGSVNMNRPFVNGNREQTNNFTVDGIDVNETIDNRVAFQPTPDAVAEISVETNNYAADVGNVGGAFISNVIKSGTNQIRGNVFEFYRNSDFDANTWENNASNAAKQERKQHIWGFTAGGPLLRDKLFIFGDYQRSQHDNPGFGTASVAPEAWRRGDLSSVTTAIKDPTTGLAFDGNQIPIGRISSTARALLNDLVNYPLPNRSVPGGVTGNFVGERLLKIRANQGDVRVDWNASSNDKIFGRYSFATYTDSRDLEPFPLIFTTLNDQPFWNLGFNWSRIFSPTIVNEVLVGYSDVTVISDTHDWAGVGAGNALYGIAGGQPIDGLTQIDFASGLTLPGAIATDSDTLAKTYQINEKLTWLKGRHTLKFGGQFLHYNQRRFYAGNNGLLGFIKYNGTFTNYPFADFLLDLVSNKGRGGGDPNDPWTHIQNRNSLFVQDDFKLTQNFTANLGLRWAYTSTLVEKDNRQTNFDLVTGQQIFAKDGSLEDRALYKPYYKGFEPRLGGAWRLNENWVVRGAYGISQFMEGTGANLRLPLNPPFFFESAVNYDTTTGAGSIASGFAGLIPGTIPSGNVRAYDPNLRPQFSQQYNAFVEHLLSPALSAQIGYVGHHATHLVTPVEGNQALPGVGDPATWASKTTRRPLFGAQPLVTTIATTAARSGSKYNALQASLRQRSYHGLEYLASYTFGKVTTNNRGFYGVFGGTGLQGVTSATEGAYWQNTYNPEAEWGPAFHDVRHNFILSGTYDLPIGKGRTWGSGWSGLTDALLGGWKLGGIFQARSGLPITVTDGRARSLQGERGAERPNCIGDPVPADQSIDHWLDINAFQLVPLGTFGNCPVGVARAPGYTNLDLVLSKRFAFGGPRYAEFRIEAFNAFNHPSFGPPARDISVPNTFGTITNTISAPRVVELAVK
ncbi:MAG TPA: carboxypeptidase regulatory-like domain-containing protein, partial [Vicinamibacterales bacterium]|nr:carboxypeptidase regulatory-like domain-containing protein [Vicinamibacterales bacterium]